MASKKPDKKTFIIFVAASVVTFGLVFLGWFFSFRQQWRNFRLPFDKIEKVVELKTEIQEIGNDFKEGVEEPANEIGNSIIDTTNEVREQAEAEAAAKAKLGELMKEELLNQEQQSTEENQ